MDDLDVRQIGIVLLVCSVLFSSVLITGCTENADENDTDGDGVKDSEDAFFLDPAASSDSDGDGSPDMWNPSMNTTDSTTGLLLDAFPSDPAASIDSDGDGFPDEWNPSQNVSNSTTGLFLDAFPFDPSASMDRDGDGYPDAWNEGKSKNDTTTALEIDQFPDHENFHSIESMFEWVDISPGTFIMGSSTGKSALQPPHQVNITKSFQILKFEVTQVQWTAVMGKNPSFFPGDDNPVERVSWKDCQSFVTLLNENDSAHTYRLPTEAEWEYCCRAESNTTYCFGNNTTQLEEFAWFVPNSKSKTHPVGQKSPNAWGLYDMHGNVFEWCQDWFDENYYKNSPTDDPQGPIFYKPSWVIRGGSWDQHAVSLTSAWRQDHTSGAGYYIGVRIVRTVN